MNVLSVLATNSNNMIALLIIIDVLITILTILMVSDRLEAAWIVYMVIVAETIVFPFVCNPKVIVETRGETMAEFEELSKDWKLVSISDDQIFTLEKR